MKNTFKHENLVAMKPQTPCVLDGLSTSNSSLTKKADLPADIKE